MTGLQNKSVILNTELASDSNLPSVNSYKQLGPFFQVKAIHIRLLTFKNRKPSIHTVMRDISLVPRITTAIFP